MISFYKGTKQNTGSASRIWFSTSERGIFVEMLKQHGWDATKGPAGVGTFKESKNDPSKRILVKLTLEEACELLQIIEANAAVQQHNAVAKKHNEVVAKYNPLIEQASTALKEKGETPLLKYLPMPVLEFRKFAAFHKGAKNSTQIFFNTWDKDETQYVFKLMKTDPQNTTETGKVSISLLLKDRETRLFKEYLSVAVAGILSSEQEYSNKVNTTEAADVPIVESPNSDAPQE
jgi:hypothetical protein